MLVDRFTIQNNLRAPFITQNNVSPLMHYPEQAMLVNTHNMSSNDQ